MTQTLPATVAAFIDASNARDSNGLIACFTPEAVVTDEGHTYRGLEEIRAWNTKTAVAYECTLDPTDISIEGAETIVTCRVTGNFPGSPVPLRFCFAMVADKITALTIQP